MARPARLLAGIVLLGSLCSAQTGNSSVVTAGYDLPNPVAVAPGQLVTLSVTGIGNLSGPFRGAGEVFRAETLPLPASLAGLSVQVHQGAAAPLDVPVYSVYQVTNCPSLPSPPCAPVTANTVQIPYELFMQPAGLFVPPGASSFARIFENGEARGDVEVLPWPSQVRILYTGLTFASPKPQAASRPAPPAGPRTPRSWS